MEEQVNLTVERPRSRKVPILVLAALVIVVGVAAYVMMGKLRPSDPAAFIPQEATFAVTVDATPTSDKKDALKYVVDMLKEAGIKLDKKDLADLDKKLGLDVEKDILRHLNGTAALAVLTEMAGTTPEMGGAIGIRSDREAAALMSIIENQLKKNKIDFAKIECNGEPCLRISARNPMSGLPQMVGEFNAVYYVGAVKNSITFSNCESAFKKMVDVANGKPSLLAEKNYTSLRKYSPAAFATSYYSGTNLYKLVGTTLQLASAMAPPGTADSIKEGIETNIATVCTAEATAKGLTFTTRAITKDSGITGKACSIDTLIAGSPKDAAIVVSLGNFTDIWTQYKKQIEKNPSAKAEMDKLFVQAKEGIGLDLNADVLDRIRSLQCLYMPKAPAKRGAFPGALNIVLKVDKPQVMSESMQKVHLVMVMMGGMTVKPFDLAGQSGFLAPVDKNGSIFSDVALGDKLILSLGGRNAAQSVITSIKSPETDLTSSDGFKLVKKHLPAQAEFLVYGDLEQIVKAFAADLTQADRKSMVAISRRVGKVASVGTSTPASYEILTVVPFGSK